MEKTTPINRAYSRVQRLKADLDKFLTRNKALLEKYAKYNIDPNEARWGSAREINKKYHIYDVLDDVAYDEIWKYMDVLDRKAHKEYELKEARERYGKLVEKDLANRVKERELEEEKVRLEALLGDFKKAYRTHRLDMAIKSHRIKWTEKKPIWDKELAEAEALKKSMREDYEIYTTKAKAYNELLNKIGNLKRNLACEELQFPELGEYLQVVEKHIADCWYYSIKVLADKTLALGGISGYTLKHADYDERLEVLFGNEQGETIYARLIWAAEYSCLVTPHERYIVTKKSTKK